MHRLDSGTLETARARPVRCGLVAGIGAVSSVPVLTSHRQCVFEINKTTSARVFPLRGFTWLLHAFGDLGCKRSAADRDDHTLTSLLTLNTKVTVMQSDKVRHRESGRLAFRRPCDVATTCQTGLREFEGNSTVPNHSLLSLLCTLDFTVRFVPVADISVSPDILPACRWASCSSCMARHRRRT